MSKTKSKSENKTEKALAAEKEQFMKQQLHNISKIMTTAETPPKEKYVRNIIMGTYKEGGAGTFWSYALNLPLSSRSLVSWKFCYLLHKILRDGHAHSARDSHRHSHTVKDMGVLWGSLHDRYGHIVALSARYLVLKMDFHVKHKVIPGNLEVSDETLEREAGVDMPKVLDMTQELMDGLDAGLKMADTVFAQLDANGAKSSSAAGQCRLAPLIPLIPDCSFLYHFSVLLLFKLHSRIAPDVLLGHRERFRDLFMSLSQFFDRAREMEFFKTVIQIPDLPSAPPNFLRAAALAEYQRPVVVMPSEERPEEDEGEPEPRDQVPQYYLLSQMNLPEAPAGSRDDETQTLKKELEVLKPELQLIKTEAQRCVTELKSQVNRLEAEVEEQRSHKQVALMESEQLRMEVEALRCANVANAGAHIGYREADGRAQAAELRFTQLKEKHAELVTGHAELMRKNAETVKLLGGAVQESQDVQRSRAAVEQQLESLRLDRAHAEQKQKQEVERLNQELLQQRAQAEQLRGSLARMEQDRLLADGGAAALQAERELLLRSARDKDSDLLSLRTQLQTQQSSWDLERDRLQRELEALRAQLQQQLNINGEQKVELERLRRDLDLARADLTRANDLLLSNQTAGSQMSGAVAGLQAESQSLRRALAGREAELAALRQAQQNLTEQEKQRSGLELSGLRAELHRQAGREAELVQKLQEEQFSLLQCAVVEAEGIVLDAVSKLDDPVHLGCTSSPDYLINRAEITLGSIDKMQQSHMVYLGNMSDTSSLLRSLTQFSHLAADTIVNAAATSHSAPTDQADRLTDSSRDCANNCLQFLKELKFQSSLSRADPAPVRATVLRLLALAQELRPSGEDVKKEELGRLVDREMLATSTAIEEAVLRMDEILTQARRDTSGLKLEVNQSILGSCSDLMKAVHMLVTSATDLQKDIVEGGRGAASVPEFYAKNSRWTEGLISASKAVGWGATQLLESADRVVGEQGTYEELIASSHEIAASTAHLVAASKVKADRNNKKLNVLQQASRHVNDMAAVVVTSTKHGQRRFSDQGAMDFSGLSLIKLKKEEMEAQVKVLQLESQLEHERVRLGELRKRHYDLAPEPGQDDEGFPPPPPPTLLDPAALSESQPYLSTAQANPFSHTYSPWVQAPPPARSGPPAAPQNQTEPSRASRRPNIFSKSGNRLKNAFKRGDAAQGES